MKKTKLDQAIAVLEAERAVIDLAIAKLKAQQGSAPKRTIKPRAVAVARAENAAS